MLPPTYFMSPNRADAELVDAQRAALRQHQYLEDLLKATGVAMVVLNADRQLVLTSPAFEALCRKSCAELTGLRLGEALQCTHAHEPPAGCGTTPSCTLCGAAQVVDASLRMHRHTATECRIVQEHGDALTMRVSGGPMTTVFGVFTVLSLQDVSGAQRRDVLERLFFHDVLNAAGALKGLVDAWPELSRGDVLELSSHAQQLATQLVEEISAQRDLRLAECGALAVPKEPVPLPDLVNGIVGSYARHRTAHGRTLRAVHGRPITVATNPVLLRRVLGNLVLNALEASLPGGEVTVSTITRDGRAPAIEVHNAGVIPKRIELQMFQRGFTTKGHQGRGLGTYSVKLLTERHLGGRVTFRTSDEEGTIFRVELPAVS